jgi:hypothetical protein
MGRRQSTPRRQNTLEHGILSDDSLSPPFPIDSPNLPTLLSCLYPHLARLKLAHPLHIKRRYYRSEPITTTISSAESYDPIFFDSFPVFSVFPSVFCLLDCPPSLRGVFGKGRSSSWPRHLRISSEEHIAYLDSFHCFSHRPLIKGLLQSFLAFSVLSWVT